MKISYDDYEAVMEAARIVVDLIGSRGHYTDQIDTAAHIFKTMNEIRDSDGVTYRNDAGLTVLYLPGCEEDCIECEDDEDGETESFEVLVNVAILSPEDNVHFVFDESKEIEWMESVPEEDRVIHGEID